MDEFYLIYIFLSKTIDFIYGSKKINEITKYAYNHKKGVRDGFSIISDELSYFLENKNISRAQELEMDLVDFLQTNYTKHSFTNDDMSFFLDEIRKIIDNTMDYNNPHSIKKILYIYYYAFKIHAQKHIFIFYKYIIIFYINPHKIKLTIIFLN